MSSGVFRDYFGRGVVADLPSASGLDIPVGTAASYYATDTDELYQLNAAGTGWEVLSSGIEEAPVDGTPYSRQDADWISASSGGGLPAGGTTGQVLTKVSNTDGDADWQTSGGGGGGGSSPYSPGVPFLASTMTAVGSGSATSFDHSDDKGITWTLTANSRRAWYKTVPGGGSDFRVVVCANISVSAQVQILFGWYDPATGNTAHFYLNENGNQNYQYRKEAPFNSYAGQDGGIAINPYSGQDMWFAAQKVGSNFSLMQSNNGVDFYPLWTNPGVMAGVFPAVLIGVEGFTGVKLTIRTWDDAGASRELPAV